MDIKQAITLCYGVLILIMGTTAQSNPYRRCCAEHDHARRCCDGCILGHTTVTTIATTTLTTATPTDTSNTAILTTIPVTANPTTSVNSFKNNEERLFTSPPEHRCNLCDQDYPSIVCNYIQCSDCNNETFLQYMNCKCEPFYGYKCKDSPGNEVEFDEYCSSCDNGTLNAGFLSKKSSCEQCLGNSWCLPVTITISSAIVIGVIVLVIWYLKCKDPVYEEKNRALPSREYLDYVNGIPAPEHSEGYTLEEWLAASESSKGKMKLGRVAANPSEKPKSNQKPGLIAYAGATYDNDYQTPKYNTFNSGANGQRNQDQMPYENMQMNEMPPKQKKKRKKPNKGITNEYENKNTIEDIAKRKREDDRLKMVGNKSNTAPAGISNIPHIEVEYTNSDPQDIYLTKPKNTSIIDDDDQDYENDVAITEIKKSHEALERAGLTPTPHDNPAFVDEDTYENVLTPDPPKRHNMPSPEHTRRHKSPSHSPSPRTKHPKPKGRKQVPPPPSTSHSDDLDLESDVPPPPKPASANSRDYYNQQNQSNNRSYYNMPHGSQS